MFHRDYRQFLLDNGLATQKELDRQDSKWIWFLLESRRVSAEAAIAAAHKYLVEHAQHTEGVPQ